MRMHGADWRFILGAHNVIGFAEGAIMVPVLFLTGQRPDS